MKLVKQTVIVNTFLTLLCTAYAHKVVINGVNNVALLNFLKENILSTSDNIGDLKDDIAGTIVAKKDLHTIRDLCCAYCYFDCNVSYSFLNGNLIFDINLGKRYALCDIDIKYVDSDGVQLDFSQICTIMRFKKNFHITSKDISSGIDYLRDYFVSQGFIRASIVNIKIKKNDKDKTFTLVCNVALHNKIVIRKTTISIIGEKIQNLKKFVQNRILWKDGECIDSTKIDETRDLLLKSGFFSGIDIQIDDVDAEKSDIIITLTEAKLHTVSAGAQYGNNTGFGVNISWIKRNVDQFGSNFVTSSAYSSKQRSISGSYNIQDVFYAKQELQNSVSFSKDELKAYKSHKCEYKSVVQQYVSNIFSFYLGGGYERSHILRNNISNSSYVGFRSLSLLAGIHIDLTDSVVDPRCGIKLNVGIQPFLCRQHFVIARGGLSCFLPISIKYDKEFVIACFIRIGSVFGNGYKNTPKDKIFYSGGFGSIRGYGYQMIGKLDENKKPFGGLSLFETGCELRYKFTESIGGVCFFESGCVHEQKIPFRTHGMQSAWGVGLRIYTILSPISIDIAFPCKKRKGKDGKSIDSSFYVYFSVSQSIG